MKTGDRPWPIGSFLVLWRYATSRAHIYFYIVTGHHQLDNVIRESIDPLRFDCLDVTAAYEEVFRCESCGHVGQTTNDKLYLVEADSLLLRLARDREAVLREDPDALMKAVRLMKELSESS